MQKRIHIYSFPSGAIKNCKTRMKRQKARCARHFSNISPGINYFFTRSSLSQKGVCLLLSSSCNDEGGGRGSRERGLAGLEGYPGSEEEMINGSGEKESQAAECSLSLSLIIVHSTKPSQVLSPFLFATFSFQPPSSSTTSFCISSSTPSSSVVLISADNTRLGYNNTPAQNTM